jgi:hypothetical protein
MMNMNEYSNPIVAMIISVLRSWILSKTNHVPASITNPATSRNRTTSALNIETPVCVHIVLNLTAGGDGTSHSSAKFACPDMRARTDKICGGPSASGVTRIGRGVAAENHHLSYAACLGLRFAYTVLVSSGAGRSGLWDPRDCLISSGAGRRGLPSLPNLSIKGLGMCED